MVNPRAIVSIAKYLYEALHELKIQNIIMKDPYHEASPYQYTLTEKGFNIARNELDLEEYSLRIENYVTNDELLRKCQELFNSGECEWY